MTVRAQRPLKLKRPQDTHYPSILHFSVFFKCFNHTMWKYTMDFRTLGGFLSIKAEGAGERVTEKGNVGRKEGKEGKNQGQKDQSAPGWPLGQLCGKILSEKSIFQIIDHASGQKENGNIEPVGEDPQSACIGIEKGRDQRQTGDNPQKLSVPKAGARVPAILKQGIHHRRIKQ